MASFEYLFNMYLNNIDGLKYSHNARSLECNREGSFYYGEPTFETCNSMADMLKDKIDLSNVNFLDLGSGIGKVLISMHYMGYFKKLYGIEILTNLANDSKKIINEYGNKFNKNISNIEILNVDFFDFKNLNDFDIIFCNVPPIVELRKKLIEKINNEAKNNTYIFSSIHPFESTNIKLIDQCETKWSWGKSGLYLGVKIFNKI